MHEVGFVHQDIKVENTAYSCQKKKCVFLDFGLSRLIREKKGEKTLTCFFGTLNYCSQEMRKCYILQNKSYVDLYENDWEALKKTIEFFKLNVISFKNIQKNITRNETNFEETGNRKWDIYEIEKLFIFLKLKYYIFCGKVKSIVELINSQYQ